MGGDGTEDIEQFNYIPRIWLAHGGAGKILEHPLTLWRDFRNHGRRYRHHTVRRRHQRQPAAQADAYSRGTAEAAHVTNCGLDFVAHHRTDGGAIFTVTAEVDRKCSNADVSKCRGNT